jgi:protein TonB
MDHVHNACFSTSAMNDRATDTAPLAVRAFLLVLVMGLHAAGVAAFSQLSGPLPHDEKAMVLRASWIEGPSSGSRLLEPQSVSPPPPARPVQATKPRERPVQAPMPRAQAQAPTPSQFQTVQSAPSPAAVEAAAPGDSMPDPGADVSSAAGAGDGMAGEGQGGEGVRDGSYVAPDFNVNYLSNPKPEYPPKSHRLKEQGLVRLRVHVTVEGRVDGMVLLTSSGYKLLDKSALDAVRRWRFRPARRAGIPVADWVIVPVKFEYQG